jgi:hypothetical protein
MEMHSTIILNDYREEKKYKNKRVGIYPQNAPRYRARMKERYKIERKAWDARGKSRSQPLSIRGASKMRDPGYHTEPETDCEATARSEIQSTDESGGLNTRRPVPKKR